MNTKELYEQFVINSYGGRTHIAIARGQGARVWDENGRSYLDFVQGIATNIIGHCHPLWVKRIAEQATQLVHVSNLFDNHLQGLLAQKLVERAGPGKVFFCNSGAESNEGLLKLARLHGMNLSGGKEGVRYKVIGAKNAFHGRTFGSMSATPQEKIQHGFRPMLDGFEFGEFNNLASFEELMDDKTAAVLVEAIQGESGITPATVEFMQGLRKLCTERNILLLADEVQCGYGRTGKFFGCENYGIMPDALSMAKGIANGFPMGAFWVAAPYCDLFHPGNHGTTFGGTPLACAAALAVLEVMEKEDLLTNVQKVSAVLHAGLKDLCAKYPQHLEGIRGKGLHVALVAKNNTLVVDGLRANGLLAAIGGNGAVRLLPPLNVTAGEINEALDIIGRTLSSLDEVVRQEQEEAAANACKR
jgi:acetylornithine aminotransferase/acetylornithine/N-succinyldiaminopimelate aminotransferase